MGLAAPYTHELFTRPSKLVPVLAASAPWSSRLRTMGVSPWKAAIISAVGPT